MAKKIKVNIFNDMKEALHDAAAYERGEVVNLRATRVPLGRDTFLPAKFAVSGRRSTPVSPFLLAT